MAIEVISEIVQKNNQSFPLIDSNNIRGGYYQVDTAEEMQQIPELRRKLGMLCYVVSEDSYYQLGKDGWFLAEFGSLGIPIYDLQMLSAALSKPANYISVPNELKETKDRTNIDILFSALRALQAEVARLKNSFEFGINSYTGTETAMSKQVGDITEEEEEPLWAIEADENSLLNALNLEEPAELSPLSGYNTSSDRFINITEATYTDSVSKECEDAKIILYLTTSSNNIRLNLKLVEELKYAPLSIDLSKIKTENSDYYNYLIVISRKLQTYGKNYIWVSINNGNNTIGEGYLDGTTLLDSLCEAKDAYYIDTIDFKNLKLYRCNVYSKYQDFSHLVVGSVPEGDTYKYRTAHITIRSVATKEILNNITKELQSNELVFLESTNSLYIIRDGKAIALGTSKIDEGEEPSDIMTTLELINKLQELGIVYSSDDGLSMNDISEITLVNQHTGDKYKFGVDGDGKLVGHLSTEEVTWDSLLKKVNYSPTDSDTSEWGIRGFVSNVVNKEYEIDSASTAEETKDYGLRSDRLKIGAIYAPTAETKFYGCSHAYIELENTSDKDLPLEGMYLHYAFTNEDGAHVEHLPLKGIIPAGGTYLIRGKRYTSNTFINVDTFDLEWYVKGNLLDLTLDLSLDADKTPKYGYAFALTYDYENLSLDNQLVAQNNGTTKSKAAHIYDKRFVDSLNFGKKLSASNSQVGSWCPYSIVSVPSNCIVKNKFELDPAKQAYQALNTYDSSRQRWNKGSFTNDIEFLELNNSELSFYGNTYKVSKFTPKASFEGKNVCTDKTTFENDGVQVVTCSIGESAKNTRCFNWVSATGNEKLWIKDPTTNEWVGFKPYGSADYGIDGVYLNVTGRYAELLMNLTPAPFVASINYGTMGVAKVSETLHKHVYSQFSATFPGCNKPYVVSKLIIKFPNTYAGNKISYCVSATKPEADADIRFFTLYDVGKNVRIYQTTDQQGFTWTEYQPWAKTASILAKIIELDIAKDDIFPVLVNTGDMTQNGTRINEWLDYFKAGDVLFRNYEQMCVVGNNDLCGTDPEILGTGDDNGKSNSFYFHVFFCYEVDENTIINNKYIPSLYKFQVGTTAFVMVNSEITETNCKNWFNLKDSAGNAINIYTGFGLDSSHTYHSEYKNYIYNTLYLWFYDARKNSLDCIAFCHEMPFTVITKENITKSGGMAKDTRSISGGNLVGSHMNLFSAKSDSAAGPGTYWFSRLLEYFKVKLCVGGHKHTFAVTYPVAEYFTFDGGTKNSKDNYEEYRMSATLENDDVQFNNPSISEYSLTKLPLVRRKAADGDQAWEGEWPYSIGASVAPCTPVETLSQGVIYLMCLASGYKLASNKELPSVDQKFSAIVPEPNSSGKAGAEQKHPMFAIIRVVNNHPDLETKSQPPFEMAPPFSIYRIKGIMVDGAFNQLKYGNSKFILERCEYSEDSDHGKWVADTTYNIQ